MPGLLFFDTETNDMINFKRPATDASQPYIIQLAAMLTDLQGQEYGAFSVLIAPSENYHFTSMAPGAFDAHGISMAECNDRGAHINAAMLLFNQMVLQSTAVIAHNIAFDAKMVASTMHRITKPNRLIARPNICTMQTYTPICKLPPKRRGTQYKWPTLLETHEHCFYKGFEGAHDAMVDVRACARCYFELPEDTRRSLEAGDKPEKY